VSRLGRIWFNTYGLLFPTFDAPFATSCALLAVPMRTFLLNSLKQPVLVRLFAAGLVEAFVFWSAFCGESLSSDLRSPSASSTSDFEEVVLGGVMVRLTLQSYMTTGRKR
jgi:hypothetical protein